MRIGPARTTGSVTMRGAPHTIAIITFAFCTATTGLAATVLAAQTTARTVGPVAGPAAQAAIDGARAMVESGQSADARVLLDSLVSASTAQPGDLADALYWRAVLSERAADAERDWKRLILDVPLSPRVPTALLRLGELEMVRGHPAIARTYLQRLARDYNEVSERPKALLWVVRSYFDERDVARACGALAILRQGGLPDGEIRLQTNALQARCTRESDAQAAASLSAAGNASERASSSARSTTLSTTTGNAAAATTSRYSVQIAAYNTRPEAEVTAQRLVARGMDARVDGDVKPFRVRIGRYASLAQAEAALAELKKKGQGGFVAVLTP